MGDVPAPEAEPGVTFNLHLLPRQEQIGLLGDFLYYKVIYQCQHLSLARPLAHRTSCVSSRPPIKKFPYKMQIILALFFKGASEMFTFSTILRLFTIYYELIIIKVNQTLYPK